MGIRVRGFLYAEIRIMGVAGVPICIAVHSRTEVGGSWYEVCGMFLRTRMAVPPLWEFVVAVRDEVGDGEGNVRSQPGFL